MAPNSAWASTSLGVPRSTSVEYEKETHSTSTRRLAPPPSRRVTKQPSALTHVSDSEAEEQHSQSIARGKSPFEHALDMSQRAINTATSFYLRQRSAEPADAATTNGKESSLDYEELDREYTALQRQRSQEDEPRRVSANRRNRMSLDNKAYRPSHSDLEESDDQLSDDGKKRRRKIKKKDLGPGTLTSLPVAGYDKRRRRKRGSRGGEADLDGAEDDQESSLDSEQVRLHSFPLSSSHVFAEFVRTAPTRKSGVPVAHVRPTLDTRICTPCLRASTVQILP
jgi:SUN domain-containing protein 1/2